jgi:hypothetical protein
MAKLPYSRVVDVTITREDRFPTTAGFNTAMLLTGTSLAGKVDATHRTKLYSSMDEVADDWASTTESYKAAARFFMAQVRPRQLKIGYVDGAAATFSTEMDALWASDSDWYWGLHTKEFNDQPSQKSMADWAETHTVLFGVDSNDIDTEAPGALPASSVAAYVQDKGYDRTAVFYHTDNSSYLAAGAFGYAAGRDLDKSNLRLARLGRIDSGQAYTLKFKGFPGVSPINKGSAAVQAITGFVPGTGLSKTAGYFANTYVDIGGLSMLVEGTVGSGAFIDEIHAFDWIKARMQESVLAVLANTARVPMTNSGVGHLIAGGVIPPLQRAIAAGVLADDIGDDGLTVKAYEIAVDDVLALPASQRRNRIAPDIKANLHPAGAVHYASITMTLKY